MAIEDPEKWVDQVFCGNGCRGPVPPVLFSGQQAGSTLSYRLRMDRLELFTDGRFPLFQIEVILQAQPEFG